MAEDTRTPAVPEEADGPAKVCVLCGTHYMGDLRFCPADGQALRPVQVEDPLVGTMVAGRYLVSRKVGQGGMGSVYLAEQVTMGRKVALKVLRHDQSGFDPDAPLRFAREAANASRLSHQNVASVYDFGEVAESGMLYLAMEFIDGDSLAGLLREVVVLPPRRMAMVASQIADALTAAHELGIVHRDLKPDNVMISRRADGGDAVKVVDFGISRVMGSATQRVTSTGMAVGTPTYMSPEQLSADAVDGRSDLFALGLVCYVMLTGESAWPTVPSAQLLTQRVMTPRRTLAEIRPEVAWPSDLQAVLDASLAIDPDQRYATVSDFVNDLLQVIASWMPDDPAAATPWDRRLRGSTPLSSTRIASGRQVAIPAPDTPLSATALFDGSRSIPPNAPQTSGARGQHAGGGASARPSPSTASPEPSPAVSRSRAMRVAWIAAIGIAGAVGVVALAQLRDGGGEPMATPAEASSGLADDEAPRPDSQRSEPDTTTVTSPAARQLPANGSPGPTTAGARSGSAAAARDDRASVAAPATDRGTATAAPGSPPTGSRPAGAAIDSSAAPDRLTAAQIREMLDQLGKWTSYDATVESATRALQLIPELMGVVRTSSDSVEAQLRAAEAHLRLDEPRLACRILLPLDSRPSTARVRSQVRAYLGSAELGCKTREQ